jgi:hypothetical protein
MLLTAALALIVAIAVPVAMAALQPNQVIHVTETPSASTPTPVGTAAPATSQPEVSTVKFSLWYPNGTTFNVSQENTPSVFGATGLAVNGVPVNVQSGLGAPPMGYTSGVIVVRNDGNVPISVNASVANVTVPSGVVLTSTCSAINPSVYGSQVDRWMGRDKLATSNTMGVGEYAWLSVQVIMTNTTGNMGAIQTQGPLSYSFDVAVTATPA